METPRIDPLGQNFHYVRRGRGGAQPGDTLGRQTAGAGRWAPSAPHGPLVCC